MAKYDLRGINGEALGVYEGATLQDAVDRFREETGKKSVVASAQKIEPPPSPAAIVHQIEVLKAAAKLLVQMTRFERTCIECSSYEAAVALSRARDRLLQCVQEDASTESILAAMHAAHKVCHNLR